MPSATSLPTSLPTTLLGALSPDPKLQSSPERLLRRVVTQAGACLAPAFLAQRLNHSPARPHGQTPHPATQKQQTMAL